MDNNYKVEFLSGADETMQPAYFYRAEGTAPRPLTVALHTWSFGLDEKWEPYLHCCKELNWNLIYPEFRGPNWKPEALGSSLVVSDLISCVEYAEKNCNVDPERIFLAGGSGGGHAALLLAAKVPELWSAVSVWCPISNIAKWHAECKAVGHDYWQHIEQACGGDPRKSAAAAKEAVSRSPVTFLENAKGKTIIDIGVGIHDGHSGSVPVSQSLEAFNILADEADRISKEDIEYIVKTETIPGHLKYDGPEDLAYGPYKVLFRRVSGNTRLTVFEGSHDILYGPTFGFLQRQSRNMEPVWYSGDLYLDTKNALSK